MVMLITEIDHFRNILDKITYLVRDCYELENFYVIQFVEDQDFDYEIYFDINSG